MSAPSPVFSMYRASSSSTPSGCTTCQSAPPASTSPDSRSPWNFPPVMAIMRRPSPSSRIGAREISAFRSGSRFKIFQEPEQIPVCARRLAFLLLLARIADEGAQRLQVGAGVLGGERGERSVVLHHASAPGLQALVARHGLRRAALDLGQPGADRRGVHLAHQLADVLHLAALG